MCTMLKRTYSLSSQIRSSHLANMDSPHTLVISLFLPSRDASFLCYRYHKLGEFSNRIYSPSPGEGKKIASLKRRKTDLIASDCIHRVHRLFSTKHEGSHCFLRGSILPIKSSLSRSMILKLCKSFSETLTEIYAFPKITEH